MTCYNQFIKHKFCRTLGDHLSILSYLSQKVYALEPDNNEKAEDFLKINESVDMETPADGLEWVTEADMFSRIFCDTRKEIY